MTGKIFIALACLSALVAQSSSATEKWNKLRVKFTSGNDRSDAFFDLPRTAADAVQQNWVQPPETESDAFTQTFCMEDDPRACVIYDNNGIIAGFQIGLPTKIDELNLPIDPLENSFERTTLFNKEVYVTKMYFVPQEVINAGGRSSLDRTGTGLWIKIRHDLVEIPADENQLLDAVPGYVKENWFPGMGQHYFYNASLDMQPDGYQPFFLLYSREQELLGLGMVMFGSKAEGLNLEGKRNWFEPLPSFVVRAICPDAADWILQQIDTNGPYSLHIYFVDEPWTI